MAAQRCNHARRRLEHWTIPIRAYGQFHGIQVATEADGVWTYESGDFIYLRWRITDIHHNQPVRFSSVSARALAAKA